MAVFVLNLCPVTFQLVPKIFFWHQNPRKYTKLTDWSLTFEYWKNKGIFTGKTVKLCWWRYGEQSFGGKSMLSLFYFWALDKLDLEILDFWFFTELSILEWFSTFFFQICINSGMYVFSNSNCSLIKFMSSHYGTEFSTRWR